ncbi:MAG TPA: right-handed parallel beta-helix repeat-containing protein [Blastocatellia bacterium]|nr:right-handed parallel beta-helix repeat-containing protein [Blastocatellia bacterium]
MSYKHALGQISGLILGIVFCLASAVMAATYWVDGTNGNSSHNCVNTTTPQTTAAELTIAAGIACLRSGDTLYIRSGTYSEQIPWPPSGSTDNPTIVSAYPSKTVTIAPANSGVTDSGTTNPAYVIFDGLIFDGTGTSGFKNGFSVCCNYSSHSVFQNGEIKNFDGNGAEIFADDVTIRNTEIHNNGSNTSAGPGHGIYSACQSGCVFELNQIYDNDHYGVHIYGGASTNVSGNIVRQNAVFGNGKSTVGLAPGGAGILLSSGSNNLAYDNIVYDNSTTAIGYPGIQISYGCTDCKAYNNTIYANGSYGIWIHADADRPVVQNNIVWGNGVGSIYDTGALTTQDHNLCNSGCTGTGSINNRDPLFVDAANANFALQSTSPAIAAGVDVGLPLSVSVPYIGAFGFSPSAGEKQ